MGALMQSKRKAFAYITQGQKLLVFEHQGIPEAGIQVPAGSVEKGESPGTAAIREVQEETGLKNLTMRGFLGEQIRDMSDFHKQEIHYRYFYHLTCDDQTPETWLHGEQFPSDEPEHDGEFRHIFRCYWLNINQLPKLIADHDYYIDKLRKLLTNQKDAEKE